MPSFDAERADLLSRALTEWDGRPFAGTDREWLDRQRTQLEAELLAARLDHLEVRLRGGEPAGTLAELTALLGEHPLAELTALLILALYRSGRQAGALREYDRVRRHLADENALDRLSTTVTVLHGPGGIGCPVW
ncbi:BTAD domain-containing putative transcriptional regulator [Kutzneria sp. 744]|uniref:AfsR/SARP family transcriptional regulator n=1 Tax=Kutzneria sp. (strain 744) TaxID=345341 RepID=UPI0026F38C9B|nr:BTAD domain-containing putative transcriptional regulator [Kutzneria sp. 744]